MKNLLFVLLATVALSFIPIQSHAQDEDNTGTYAFDVGIPAINVMYIVSDPSNDVGAAFIAILPEIYVIPTMAKGYGISIIDQYENHRKLQI